MAVFLVIGFTVVYVTNKDRNNANNLLVNTPAGLVSSQEYPGYIRPWLEEVVQRQNLEAVRDIKTKILNLRGADRSLGQAQVSLYLAFDSWEQFLLTKDKIYKNKATENLNVVAKLFPDLSSDLDKIKNIIN